MSDNKTLSLYAILYELNEMEFQRKLQNDFGIDYKKIQQQMVSINMDFYSKSTEQNSSDTGQ